VGNLELLPAIVTHWERTAKPITRPLKVEDLCKAFVLYRQGKGLDKATLSEDRYISNALRHSYASYWLARSSKEGLGELSKGTGNSEAVCKRHYLETLTREEGACWFKIRRSKAGAEAVSMVSAKAA
jgi:hypothetical protein